jgi:hypothetical protein
MIRRIALLLFVLLVIVPVLPAQSLKTSGTADTLAVTSATRKWARDSVNTGGNSSNPVYVTVTNETSGKLVWVAQENDTGSGQTFYITSAQGSFTWLTGARWIRRLPADTTVTISQVICTRSK